jgi:DNA (cytosine-5)-methyltransferase 1
MNLYNEFEPYAADWLENLISAGHIPGGTVDRRSIKEITGSDLTPYSQCHFFTGIAGWPYALRLAGWPDDRPVWTGSAPCQPFSAAGKQEGFTDERDLWPDFFRLIRERRPETVFGEQVSNAVGFGWIDRVQADLAAEGYTLWYVVLGAHSLGAPHIRQRLYWGAYTNGGQREQRDTAERTVSIDNADGRMGESFNTRLERHAGNGNRGSESGRIDSITAGSASQTGGDGEGLDHTTGPRRTRQPEPGQAETVRDETRGEESERRGGTGFWSRYDIVPCSDGKARRVEPGTFPLAHGVPARVGKLRAYGNAIVPQVAAEFVKAFMELQ